MPVERGRMRMNNKKESRSLPLFGIPRLFPFLKKYRARIAFMILLGFLSSLIDTIYPLFNRYAIDHFVADGTLDGIGVMAAVYLVILLFQVITLPVEFSQVCKKIVGCRQLVLLVIEYRRSLSVPYCFESQFPGFCREFFCAALDQPYSGFGRIMAVFHAR